MEIRLVTQEKKAYLPLLLLADEEEAMIDKYLERGDLHALYDDGKLRCVCVVTDEGDGVYEIQNIATQPEDQRRGYGRAMIEHVFAQYAAHCRKMLVGTGDSPNTLPFYENCGFVLSHRIKNYMIEHYAMPIFEDGVQLFDKVYLVKEFA